MFLLIRTPRSKVSRMIRTACQSVGDIELMQLLRETLEPDVLYQISSSDPYAFEISVTINNLGMRLRYPAAWTLDKPSEVGEKSSSVTIEWLTEGRAWALELTMESVELVLLDGPSASVNATLHVDPPSDRHWVPGSDMDFPPDVWLVPLSEGGSATSILRPNWGLKTWGATENKRTGTQKPATFQVQVRLKGLDDPSPTEAREATESSPEEEGWSIVAVDGGLTEGKAEKLGQS
ncbi:hypothetical protein FRB90_004779 [Tulasnella sp. 427]|nr:hypothetical protein FRB90_004779 [Tulasnella sp. 427]